MWKGDDGSAIKARSPWGQLPLLEVDGAVFGQSSAIASYCGQLAGLVPSDPLVALQMNGVCQFLSQDIRDRLISPTMKFKEDEVREQTARTREPKSFLCCFCMFAEMQALAAPRGITLRAQQAHSPRPRCRAYIGCTPPD